MLNIIIIYVVIVSVTLFATALLTIDNIQPKEIKNFYSWVFYAVLFPLIWIKELIKFLINLFKK
jgi:hypothetical protein